MAKSKKSNLSDTYAKKRKQQIKKKTLTPFEVHVNRDKQNVLGRKSKADQGLPGIARTKAIAKRKNTLLLEYKVKDKDNIFLDRRIGEKNAGMTQEDKAMARFAAERMKSHNKKNIFNLNDDEVLTHRGQTLMDIEKYDDPRSDEDEYSDDENRTGKLDKKFVEDAHFGGGVLSKPDSEMSRKDLIDQLIAESKKRKAERQKIREQTVDLTEKLDSEWRDLLPIIASSNKSMEVVEEKSKADDYDRAVKELKFEARGMPTDKLKSEEEIATEEKNKLEKLELDRLARMKGFSDEAEFNKKHKSADELDDFHIEKIEVSDNEDNDLRGILTNNDEKIQNKQNKKENKNNKSKEDEENDNIDDEEDEDEMEDEDEDEDKDEDEDEDEDEKNVDNDEDEDIKNNDSEKENSNEESDEESEEAEEESEDNLSDLKASDSSDEEDKSNVNIKNVKKNLIVNSAHKTESMKEQNNIINTSKLIDSNKSINIIKINENFEINVNNNEKEIIMEKARQELPYTFKAPLTYEELKNLFQNQNPDYQSVIIERIIKCNHWKLAEGNKEKLLNLFSFLLQHLEDCSSVNNLNELIMFFKIFDRLCPHLYDLTHANPEGTKNCLQEILKQKHDEYESKIKVYPGLYTLILFKLISIIYPTSDFRHPIVTPCLVFMSQILFRCKIKEKLDISKGLFICTLILEYTLLSKRWSPAVINFLRGIIYVSFPKPFSKLIRVISPFKAIGETSNILVLENNHKNLDMDPASVKMQVADLIGEQIDDDYRIRTFVTAINLLCEFQQQCSELDAAYSIFEPILSLFKSSSVKRYPKKVKEKIKTLISDLENLQQKKLEHLTFNKKKPKALRMYEPRVEVVHDGKRHKPMSKEKAEKEKLLHKLKKETKSAIREIRRDNVFLSKVKIKQQIASDTERKRRVKEIYGDAALQQSELKKFKKK